MRNIIHGFGQVYPLFGSGVRAPYPKCLVLEVGADHPGDIEHLVKWLHPDIAVITAVSKVPVHVEFFPSPAAVLKEKLWLARGVKCADGKGNQSGKLVLPANDPSILAVRKDVPDAPCLTFGIDSGDVTASSPEIIYEEIRGIKKPTGMAFDLKYQSNSARIFIAGIVGVQHIHSIVAASAAALSYGISFDAIVSAIKDYSAPRGRMNILDGIVGSVLIDDTYNSSPDAVREALNIVRDIDMPRKIAVLGDMMELGKFSAEQHRKIGEQVASASITTLVTVGIRAKDIAEGAIAAGMSKNAIHSFDTSVETGEWLRNLLHKESLLQGNPGTVILIKGSQSPRLERITYALLADQSRAAEFLVRQDAEWLAKK